MRTKAPQIDAAASPRCPGFVREQFAESVCFESETGIVIAATLVHAAALAAEVEAGALRFEAALAVAVPRWAVIEQAHAEALSPQLVDAFASAGYPVALSWMSTEAMGDQLAESIRRGVRTQLADRGRSESEIERAVQSALAQVASLQPQKLGATLAGALPHELAHKWFVQAFWPGLERAGSSHYSGPAPDWLDELAAIAVEPDSLRRSRRLHLLKVFQQQHESGLAGHAYLDLQPLFAADHPMRANLAKAAAPHGHEAGWRVMTGAEAESVAGDAALYYSSIAALQEFLIEQSGDPAIAGSLARSVAAGADVATWLHTQPALPQTVEALSQAWWQWLLAQPPAEAGSPPAAAGK